MSITLKYGPNQIFNCDTPFDEQIIQNVSNSTSTSNKKEGTASAQIFVYDEFTTGVIGSKAITSTDMSSATQVRFWIYSNVNIANGVLEFLLDNTPACASPLEALNVGAITASTWTQKTLNLVTPANLTAIVSIGFRTTSDIGEFQLNVDNIELVTVQKTFSELRVLGFDNPEGEEAWPDVPLRRLIDGSWYETRKLTKTRNIHVELDRKETQNISDLIFFERWWFAKDLRQLIYNGETLDVVIEGECPISRDQGLKQSKAIAFDCKEKTAKLITTIPTAFT